ncbi:MAG: HAD-IA family hydrolase [Desulfobacterales bacterium]
MKKKPRYIHAVLFDFDGTLTRPESLDLNVIKRRIGCPADSYLLEYIETLPSADERQKALEAVDQFELAAAAEAKPNDGAEELVGYLHTVGVRVGIVTRNSHQSVLRALHNFKRIDVADFDIIVSRDEPVNPKPSGDGIHLAARRLNVAVAEVLMVGDYAIDIEAGIRAGAITVLLDNHLPKAGQDVPSDFTVEHLADIQKIVRHGRPLPGGKLPNDLLEEFLVQFGFDDPAVLTKPGIGEDTAAVDIREDEVLVLKSDPITFATEGIGKYAVLVNANDIVTAGATPRWFLATLMFPIGTSAFMIRDVMEELSTVCRSCRITLCGGHTEITDAVTRPVVTGTLAGTVTRGGLIDKRGIKTGDLVLMTKAVAVEGTAIIAREFGTRLQNLGLPPAEIETCRRFLDNISVLPEAAIAVTVSGVSAMHDVTEGGLATALEELSIAGNHRIRIDMHKIPVYSETARICGLLGLDPMGLIGSGSLLLCCRQYACDQLLWELRKAGIEVSVIGEIREPGKGIDARHQLQPVTWPRFEADEITRLFSA